MRDKASDFPIGGVLKPQAIAAAGNATGAWVDARTAAWWVALLSIGAGGGIGSGAFTIVQATDSSGTGSKAVANAPGSATTTLAVDGASGVIDLDPQSLDLANSFFFVAIKCVMTGGTNSVASGVLCATDSHYET
jgi:hypothetical protein